MVGFVLLILLPIFGPLIWVLARAAQLRNYPNRLSGLANLRKVSSTTRFVGPL